MSTVSQAGDSAQASTSSANRTSNRNNFGSGPYAAETAVRGHAEGWQMENLVRIINKLQDAATKASSATGKSTFAFDLPQIAVVGSQSSGKSSVLEAFVGKEFLPRGSGIVTRRPLVLQLLMDNSEYGEFTHLQGKKFYDFREIRTEIERETDRVTGSNKGISPIPINLRIHSPQVLDLTLIDLPGLTRVPVGDQPRDIEEQIRNMVLQYISNENCLILAVSPANADLANSDALRIAKDVDPHYSRTIGVLTKLDLMDEGTHAGNVLNNQVYPLKYGYIGVVNRSQRDIDSGKDMHSAAESERRFFLGHEIYKTMCDRMGTSHLQKMLNLHLTRHIAANLPEVRSKLHEQILRMEEELAALNLQFDQNAPNWKLQAAIILTFNFGQRFRRELIGTTEDCTNLDSFTIGADIRHLFHVKYPLWLAATKLTDERVLKRQIGFAILNTCGVRTGIFTPDKAFEIVLKELIMQMRPATEDLLKVVLEKVISPQVMQCMTESLNFEVGRFPLLKREIERECSVQMMRLSNEATPQVEMLVDLNVSYLNLKHEDFIGFNFNFDATNADYMRRVRKNPIRDTIHEGWLIVHSGSLRRDNYWFVLTCESLSWYTTQTQEVRVYSILIDSTLKTNFRDNNRTFTIMREEGKGYLFKTATSLELTAAGHEEMEEWIVKLVDVGVYYQGREVDLDEDGTLQDDAHLRRQIQSIYVMVDSYMRVVRMQLQDMVPKAIVHSVIRKAVNYVERLLVAQVCRFDLNVLMEEDPASANHKRELDHHVAACRQALNIIADIPSVGSLIDRNYNPTKARNLDRPPPRPEPPKATGTAQTLRPAPPPKAPTDALRKRSEQSLRDKKNSLRDHHTRAGSSTFYS